MSSPILTIIIPTYNRSANLAILLATLRDETTNVARDVVVKVYDNCSTDDTPKVIALAAIGWQNLSSHRHSTNIGADRNFCYAVEAVKTRWFWIIGDDDLPKRGVVSNVIDIIRSKNPALLYMQSEWIESVQNADQGVQVYDFKILSMNSLKFAEAIHIWTTFISGMVIDKNRLLTVLGDHNINRFDATSLVQLGWVIPMLKSVGPFLYIANNCILATKDNTGGYALLTVFCINFPGIVMSCLDKDSVISKKIIKGALSHYLPGLVWSSRISRPPSANFSKENPWDGIEKSLGHRWEYWLFLMPIGKLPIPVARIFYYAWLAYNKYNLLLLTKFKM